ncbi:hypothetical protein TNIN_10821 [Trichonephila inaurata madagascariensis]|uniref:Uncharacterized protein n=1 Tax=Trichonephila inaurata madagascariensis TaxID=2747483 RepID=A0A8X7C423_9ARAC|nr:hypothetical protein TNIN_10821 [Trichonephila inaurata madagascariensis]
MASRSRAIKFSLEIELPKEKKMVRSISNTKVQLRHFCIKVFGSFSPGSDEACLTLFIGREDKKRNIQEPMKEKS